MFSFCAGVKFLSLSANPCNDLFNGSILSRINLPNSSETSPSSFFSCVNGPNPSLAIALACPPKAVDKAPTAESNLSALPTAPSFVFRNDLKRLCLNQLI